MKLNVKAAALTGGILWGATVLIMTIISGLTNSYGPAGGEYAGYGGLFLKGLTTVYPGYNISITGAIIGTVYGLVDGLICMAVVAAVYNLFCGSGKSEKS
jgi:hypothetical protein